MARAGRGGNTSLRGAVAGGTGPAGLLLAAIFLGPLLLFMKAREDRCARGPEGPGYRISRTRKEVAEMAAIGAGVLAIDAAIIFTFL
jgi:hypothetical protein